ncbi:hypothetical protein COBT_002533 [Conglomerata obtusa]
MYIMLNNSEKKEIINFILDDTFLPVRLKTKEQKKVFKNRAKKFFYCDKTLNLPVFKFKAGQDRILRFFSLEEYHSKIDCIKLLHISNGHAGRDRLHGLVTNLVYGVTRAEISNAINEFEFVKLDVHL